jgi:hypothetical protein
MNRPHEAGLLLIEGFKDRELSRMQAEMDAAYPSRTGSLVGMFGFRLA